MGFIIVGRARRICFPKEWMVENFGEEHFTGTG